MSRPYQIVIFGASGFTGEYVVENLAKYLSKNRVNLSWAAAGRSEAKVKNSLQTIGTKIGMNLDDIPILTADVSDPSSLDNLTRQAVLLINCTGPFRFYGEAVVAACVRNVCHYVDITGEPQFMENVQLKYYKEAEEKGVYVIPGCGFDSIPCDVGMNFIRDSFAPGTLNAVETFLTGIGSLTGNTTTWDCAVEGFGDVSSLTRIRRQLMEQQFKDVASIRPKFTLPRRKIGKYSDQNLTGYSIPFAGADRSVVRRSQLANKQYFGEDMIQMDAYMVQGFLHTAAWMMMGLWLTLLAKYPWGRGLLQRFPRFFTLGMFRPGGPSESEVDAGGFEIYFKGVGWKEGENREQPPKSTITTRVSGPHPGYPACAICVNQAAITVLEENDKLPGKGGVFTPGTAFRKASLIKRLNENGIKFEVL